jgi:starch synthase
MCDVVVVPSVVDADGNVDGLPNVLLEAMASGRAVVASDVGGISSVVDDGITALLVPPGDPDALRSTLLCLLGDPSFRRKLGAMARDRVIRGYQWSVVADRTASLYECAVKRSSRHR